MTCQLFSPRRKSAYDADIQNSTPRRCRITIAEIHLRRIESRPTPILFEILCQLISSDTETVSGSLYRYRQNSISILDNSSHIRHNKTYVLFIKSKGISFIVTRVFYLPDELTVTILDVPQPAAWLLERLNSGAWSLPIPAPAPSRQMQVVRLGDLILITALPIQFAAGLDLTPRQTQVLRGLMDGLTVQQIALRLNIAPRTVTYHIAQIKQRLGAGNLAQAVSRVQQSLP